jgi:Cdc6-like AAA superfamily ATPase
VRCPLQITQPYNDNDMTNVADILTQFLSDPEKRTLILKGKWGVGKTYAWKNFIEKQKTSELAVSYVSLFGVGSVPEVWRQILTNAVPKNRKEFKQLGKIVAPIIGILKQVPYAKAALGSTEQLAPLLVRRFLICFDDLERKAAQLPLATLLGFVSILKEAHDCRVVLILNEDQLNEEDRRSLNTYQIGRAHV